MKRQKPPNSNDSLSVNAAVTRAARYLDLNETRLSNKALTESLKCIRRHGTNTIEKLLFPTEFIGFVTLCLRCGIPRPLPIKGHDESIDVATIDRFRLM